MKPNKILFIAINEVSSHLLELASKELDLPSLKTLCRLRHGQGLVSLPSDHRLLQPWVVWTTLYSGRAIREHGIRYLGETFSDAETIWDSLARLGEESLVVMPLNGTTTDPSKVDFVPDPWSTKFIKPAHFFESIYDFGSLMCKTRRRRDIINHLVTSFLFFRDSLHSMGPLDLLFAAKLFVSEYIRFPKAAYHGFSVFEFICGLQFAKVFKDSPHKFGFLFLNSLAHIQHYHWTHQDKLSHQLIFGFKILDKLLEKVFFKFPPDKHSYFFHNGLSQQFSLHENWHSYRIKNFKDFLSLLKLENCHASPLMSDDLVIEFLNSESVAGFKSKIDEVTLNDESIFECDAYEDHPCKIFVRVCYFKKVTPTDLFKIGNDSFRFLEHSDLLALRHGKHCPKYDYWTNIEGAPLNLSLEEVKPFLVDHLCSNSPVNIPMVSADVSRPPIDPGLR